MENKTHGFKFSQRQAALRELDGMPSTKKIRLFFCLFIFFIIHLSITNLFIFLRRILLGTENYLIKTIPCSAMSQTKHIRFSHPMASKKLEPELCREELQPVIVIDFQKEQ